MDFMPIFAEALSVQNVIFMCINFVILVGALWFFAGKKVKNSFKGRITKIEDELKKADEAGENARKYLETASHADTIAEQNKATVLEQAKMRIEKNSAESAQKCQEEKRSIIHDAEEVGDLLRADLNQRVYVDTVNKLSETAKSLLSDEKFDSAKQKLQERFIDDVSSEIKPTRSDIVRLNGGGSIDVMVSGSEEVDEAYVEKLRKMIADNFIEFEFDTDPGLDNDLQIQIGDGQQDDKLKRKLQAEFLAMAKPLINSPSAE